MRTFIALKIPNDVSLNRPIEELSSIGGMKVYGPNGLHITLSFIGEIEEERTSDILDSLNEATKDLGPFDITLKNMGSFPGKNGPRIVWLGTESKGIIEALAERLADRLKVHNVEYDNKKFVPHITVGRARDGLGSSTAEPVIEKYSDTKFFNFVCDKITIYSSELRPEGPIHKAISHVML
jgi:2'-5' RNA ligase